MQCYIAHSKHLECCQIVKEKCSIIVKQRQTCVCLHPLIHIIKATFSTSKGPILYCPFSQSLFSLLPTLGPDENSIKPPFDGKNQGPTCHLQQTRALQFTARKVSARLKLLARTRTRERTDAKITIVIQPLLLLLLLLHPTRGLARNLCISKLYPRHPEIWPSRKAVGGGRGRGEGDYNRRSRPGVYVSIYAEVPSCLPGHNNSCRMPMWS